MSTLADRLAAARRASGSPAGSSTTTSTTTTEVAPGRTAEESGAPQPARHRGPVGGAVTPEASVQAAAAAAASSATAGSALTTRRPAPAEQPSVGAAARRTLASQQGDRIEELKSNVHVELLKQLGPHLYASDMDQDELDQRVRAVLAEVLGAQDRPLSSSDRARVTQEISDDILGYGPIEPYLRDPRRLGGHGQRPRLDLAGEGRPAGAGHGPVRR